MHEDGAHDRPRLEESCETSRRTKRKEQASSNSGSKWPKNSLKVGPCASQILVPALDIE